MTATFSPDPRRGEALDPLLCRAAVPAPRAGRSRQCSHLAVVGDFCRKHAPGYVHPSTRRAAARSGQKEIVR